MSDDVKAQRADELFDVVNERDEVIGQATRGEVHRRKLWHRAIHVLVFNVAGEVFLQKRSMAKDMAPGCWDSSCSGHLDAGEGYDAAAVRELGEEIGIVPSVAPRRWIYETACAATGWEFVWVYRLEHEGPFTLHPAEIDEGRWMAVDALSLAIEEEPQQFAPAFRHIWWRLVGEGKLA